MGSQSQNGTNGESLTKVDVDDLTDPEWADVIPSRDYVVVGYASNRSDADVLEQRVDDPRGPNDFHEFRVRGTISGRDPEDDERGIGFNGGTVYSTGATLGNFRYVKIPDYDEIDKTNFVVTFRAHDGNYSLASSDEGVIEGVTEGLGYDHEPYSVDNSDAQVIEWEKDEDHFVKRAVFDMVVRLTLPTGTPRDDVVEKARDKLRHSYEWEEDVPPIGEHITESDSGSVIGIRSNARAAGVLLNATVDEE